MGAFENTDVCPDEPTPVYVNHANTGIQDGNSWATAYTDLQDGINKASDCLYSTDVWVAAGTYLPTDEFDADGAGGSVVREKTFYISKNVKIYGGFDGTETMLSQRDWVTNTTILSGDIDNTPNDNSGNAYHVMFIDGTTSNGNITPNDCILDGFIVEKGNASGSGENSNGGAIFQKGDGSGNECSVGIFNCSFSNNSAFRGGALFNSGDGGISSPQLTNCIFFNNTANFLGGALYNGGNSGTSSPQLTNCTFYNNTANQGGALYNQENGGTSSPQLTNCILWNNGDEIFNSNATTTLNYCLLDDGTIDGNVTYPSGVSGSNNIDADPLFVDAANGNLRLSNGSPAIDVGNNAASGLTGITTDLDRNNRIIDGTVDMGAFESGCATSGLIVYVNHANNGTCLLYTSPSPRDATLSRMPSSA